MKRATIWRIFAGLLAVAFWLLGAQALGLTRRSTNIIAGTGISVGAVDNTTTGQQDWTISSTVTGGVTSVTGSSGVSCSPTSGAVTCSSTLTLPTVSSGTGITVTGGPAYTVALTTPVAAGNGGTGLSSPSAHAMLAAEGASPMTAIGPCSTGQAIVYTGGPTSDPACSTLTVPGGGTGLTSSGASGNVLTSNGSSWTSSPVAINTNATSTESTSSGSGVPIASGSTGVYSAMATVSVTVAAGQTIVAVGDIQCNGAQDQILYGLDIDSATFPSVGHRMDIATTSASFSEVDGSATRVFTGLTAAAHTVKLFAQQGTTGHTCGWSLTAWGVSN